MEDKKTFYRVLSGLFLCVLVGGVVLALTALNHKQQAEAINHVFVEGAVDPLTPGEGIKDSIHFLFADPEKKTRKK